MQIKDGVFIVTGASSGIGLSTAIALSERGAKVALLARSTDALKKLSQQLPGSLPVTVDMTQFDRVREAVRAVHQHYGRIDGLVNNAGRSYAASVEEIRSKLLATAPARVAPITQTQGETRMKAVRLLEYGGQLVFNDVPTPTIASDEVLVKVKSTAVNHLDLVEASRTARQILPIELPWIPGHEFSGVAEQIGSDVADMWQGDAVFGTTSGMGAYTEYLAVKAAVIARKPSNLSFEEAASVPVAAQTAWEGLFTHGHLEKGQTILIHAGAGAVGAYAVQLASHAGATVIATARGDDEAYVKSLGASRVINYRETQFEKVLRDKVDVVFDLVGGDTQKRSFLVLKEGGYLVSAVQPVSQEEAAKHRVTGAMMRLAPSEDMLGKVARLLEEGTIRPDVAKIYALQDAAQAWTDIAGNLPGVHGTSPDGPGAARRRSHGKIVLRVASHEHEIRSRAYELYLARGAQPGRELEDWLQAEREFTAE